MDDEGKAIVYSDPLEKTDALQESVDGCSTSATSVEQSVLRVSSIIMRLIWQIM